MRIEEFEKSLKKSAVDHAEKVDADQLWGDVSRQLHHKRKRRVMPYWIIGIMLLMSITFFPIKKSWIKSSENVYLENSIIEQDEDVTSVNHTRLSESEDIIDESTNRKIGMDSATKKKPLFKKNEYKRNFENHSKSDDQLLDNATGSTVGQSLFPGKKEVAEGNAVDVNSIQILSKENSENYGSKDDRQSLIASENTIQNNLSVIPLYLPLSIASMSKELSVKLPEYEFQNYNLRHDSWYFGMRMGVDHWDSHRQSLGQDFNPTADFRERVTEELLAWRIEINAMKKLTSRLNFITGIEFQSKYSRGEALIISERDVIVEDALIERVIGPNGVMEIFGTATVSERTESVRSRIYRQNRISVPIKIQYFLGVNTLKPFVGAGVYTSLIQSNSGYLQFSEGSEYETSVDELERMNNSISFHPEIEIGMTYSFSDDLLLQMAIPYRFSLSSNFSKGILYSEKDYYTGVRIGMFFTIQ